ncbi:MAG: GlsB/YeaQ/YmgE family stress response membrane protein [Candidatus Levybacteria bacterium]|nr:GlsB/YeaQ/YmgE family stress response membrane protein [Candidatus Levybacteria bacterium]
MDILAWAAFGLIAGTIANIIDPRPSSGGILGSMVLGIVGALVGGFLANLVFGVGVTGFNLTSFVVAVIGALIVLFGVRAFTRSSI